MAFTMFWAKPEGN